MGPGKNPTQVIDHDAKGKQRPKGLACGSVSRPLPAQGIVEQGQRSVVGRVAILRNARELLQVFDRFGRSVAFESTDKVSGLFSDPGRDERQTLLWD